MGDLGINISTIGLFDKPQRWGSIASGKVEGTENQPAGSSQTIGAKGKIKPEPNVCWTGAFVADIPIRYPGMDKTKFSQRMKLLKVNIASFEQAAGQPLKIILGFAPWGAVVYNKTVFLPFPKEFCDIVHANGSIPFIKWEPWKFKREPGHILDEVLSGRFDKDIEKWFAEARDWGHPIFLSFAHEMNKSSEDYPWTGEANGKENIGPAKYIAVWRHVYEIAAEVGANNITWVWCPDAESDPDQAWNLADRYYPGDRYVDWIGVDGYNFGGAEWKEFSEIFGSSLEAIKKYEKPIMIAEFASAEEPGNGRTKKHWISDAFAFISQHPEISTYIWFNPKKERDWRVNSSKSSLETFWHSVSGSRYTSISVPPGWRRPVSPVSPKEIDEVALDIAPIKKEIEKIKISLGGGGWLIKALKDIGVIGIHPDARNEFIFSLGKKYEKIADLENKLNSKKTALESAAEAYQRIINEEKAKGIFVFRDTRVVGYSHSPFYLEALLRSGEVYFKLKNIESAQGSTLRANYYVEQALSYFNQLYNDKWANFGNKRSALVGKIRVLSEDPGKTSEVDALFNKVDPLLHTGEFDWYLWGQAMIGKAEGYYRSKSFDPALAIYKKLIETKKPEDFPADILAKGRIQLADLKIRFADGIKNKEREGTQEEMAGAYAEAAKLYEEASQDITEEWGQPDEGLVQQVRIGQAGVLGRSPDKGNRLEALRKLKKVIPFIQRPDLQGRALAEAGEILIYLKASVDEIRIASEEIRKACARAFGTDHTGVGETVPDAYKSLATEVFGEQNFSKIFTDLKIKPEELVLAMCLKALTLNPNQYLNEVKLPRVIAAAYLASLRNGRRLK